MWWFPWENGSNPHKTPTTQPFSFIFVAMILFFNKNSTPLKIFQIGAVGKGTICGKKWACTPQQIKHMRQNWQAPNFTFMDRAKIHISYYVNFGACQSWRPCSIHILKTPFCLAQSAPSGNLVSVWVGRWEVRACEQVCMWIRVLFVLHMSHVVRWHRPRVLCALCVVQQLCM